MTKPAIFIHMEILLSPAIEISAKKRLSDILGSRMNPDLLALGFLEYVVFLLSTTCHEAAHSLAALWEATGRRWRAGRCR